MSYLSFNLLGRWESNVSEHFATLPVSYSLLQGEILVLYFDIPVFKAVSMMGMQSAFAAPSGGLCSIQGEI